MRDNRSEAISEARRIIRLAWPIMLASLNWTLMHMIDVAVVGHYGTAELAALAASRILTFISIVIGFAGLAGVLVFAARADGAGDLARTGDILRSGLILGLMLGSLMGLVLGYWALELLTLVDVQPELRGPGAAVVQAMAIAFPAQFLQAAGSYFLEGISRPRRVMAVNLTMLPVNAFLAWGLVGGHLGLAPLGAVGAALATAIVSWGGAIATLTLVWRLPRAQPRGIRDWSVAALRRAARGVPALAGFGLMPAIGASLELAGFAWLMILSTQLGNAAAGAFQAMLSVHNIAFAWSMGFGSAAGVRVGNAIGAGELRQAWPRSLIAGALATIVLGAGSLLLVFGSQALVWPFSDDSSVLALAASMLAIMGAFVIFDGLQYVFGSALRSLGEQVWASFNGIIGFFLVTGGLGWLLVRWGWGPNGLALAAGAGMLVSALLQFGRLAWVLRIRDRRPG
ncbi:MAG: MATE family efflux transporter [Allosphingosinicella sp.]